MKRNYFKKRAILSAFLIFAALPVDAQSPIDKEFMLHIGARPGSDPTVRFFPSGHFLAMFLEFEEGKDTAWVRRFTSSGRQISPDIIVSKALDEERESVTRILPALDDDGSFFAAWYEIRQGSSGNLFQRYSAEGTPLGEPMRFEEGIPWAIDFLIAGQDRILAFKSRLEADFALPYFVVVEEFSSTNGALLHEFRPAPEPDRNQQPIGLFQVGPQELVVAWASCVLITGDCDLFQQHFSREGIALSPRVRINRRRTPEDRNYQASIAVDFEGNSIAVWEAQELNGPLQDIYAQRVSASGEKIGRPFVVNRVRLSAQRDPSVASDRFGNFVVAWQSFDPAIGFSGWHVRAQLFRKDGRRVGREIVIPNPGGDNDSWNPTAVFGPNGTFLLHYVATGPVLIRRYAASPADEPCVRTRRGVECDTGRTGGEAELPLALRLFPGDVPLLGDVDGDGRADPCVRRGRRFLCDTDHEGGDFESVVSFGRPDEVPLLGDVDGDGKAEACVRSGRSFLCDTARDGGRAELSVPFGEKDDLPLLGDLDGDGRDDLCVYRNGRFSCGSLMIEFGEAGDQPVLGDFDGDGDDDPCVFREGRFLCDTAHDGGEAETALAFGGAGDRPLLGNIDGL